MTSKSISTLQRMTSLNGSEWWARTHRAQQRWLWQISGSTGSQLLASTVAWRVSPRWPKLGRNESKHGAQPQVQQSHCLEEHERAALLIVDCSSSVLHPPNLLVARFCATRPTWQHVQQSP